MAPRKAATPVAVYQLKITLKDAKPPIWRRVQVLNSMTLQQLHSMIQRTMGWYNSHLHQFTIAGVEYGQPMPDYDEFELKDEKKFKLHQVIQGEKFKFHYLYDMGDSWEHEILVEKVMPQEPGKRYPICITGKRACPPEDCGGVWGYVDFVAAIQDPEHPEHEAMVDWIGGDFDPEFFDVNEVNRQLL